MRRQILKVSFIFGMLVGLYQTGVADEVDELFAKAKALKAESQELLERGHEDESRALERESDELWALATKRLAKRSPVQPDNSRRDSPGLHEQESEASKQDSHIAKLKERIQDLDEAQQHALLSHASESELNLLNEKRRALEQELELHQKVQTVPPEFRPAVRNLEIARRRLHHIRVAADNLKAAEVHDIAHQLTMQADDMQRHIKAAEADVHRVMHGEKHAESDRDNDIRRLKKENEELRQQMKKLAEVVERLSQAEEK